jgi:hypothetical protein
LKAGRDDRDLLKLLPFAAQAAFNSSNKQHAPLCLPGTRDDVLARAREWADGFDEKGIFWLNGMAGTGKSTIARTIANIYHEQGRLGASFFFSRGEGDLGSCRKVFTTLATQLANKSPNLKSHICDAVAENTDISNFGLYYQWEKFILQPLSKLENGSFAEPIIIVIDALDECRGEEDVRLVLQLLAMARSLPNVRLRIFVASRPETPIRDAMCDIPEDAHQDYDLHNIFQSIVKNDIHVFFKHEIEAIRHKWGLAMEWPGDETIELLVQRAGGLFVYAATVCHFLNENGQLAQLHLDLILQHDNTGLPPKELDEIYTTILTNSVNAEKNKDLYKQFNHVVGLIIVLFDTLPVTGLAEMLQTQKEAIYKLLMLLPSVLDIPKCQDGRIQLFHSSFRDFLLDRQRCPQSQFWIDKKQAHHDLF